MLLKLITYHHIQRIPHIVICTVCFYCMRKANVQSINCGSKQHYIVSTDVYSSIMDTLPRLSKSSTEISTDSTNHKLCVIHIYFDGKMSWTMFNNNVCAENSLTPSRSLVLFRRNRHNIHTHTFNSSQTKTNKNAMAKRF